MSGGGKYLTFNLQDEDYGIPINKVKEIIGVMPVTKVPKMPGFIKGVINLRGKIIPIVDLRLKFDMDSKDYTERTCIIVTEMFIENTQRQMGIVVDTVSEVLNITESEMEPPPKYGGNIKNDYLTGLGKVKEKVIMLIDIAKILDISELELINEIV